MVYSPLGSCDSPVHSPPGSQDSPGNSSPGRGFGQQGVILLILKSIRQSLKGLFTDFKEHTTIFKGSIILQIDCRLTT
jgi:hypothetical protein